MNKTQFDTLVKVSDWLEGARGKVENFVNLAEVVVTEGAANALQVIDSAQSKISEAMLADPVEDVSHKPGKKIVDSLLDNIVKQARATDKAMPFDWSQFTDSPKAPRKNATPNGDPNADASKTVRNISEDMHGKSRDEKIELIREHLHEWKSEEFAATQSDTQVDAAYLGVRLGLEIVRKFKGQ